MAFSRTSPGVSSAERVPPPTSVYFATASGASDILSGVSSASYISGGSPSSPYSFTLAIDLNTDGLKDLITLDNSTYAQQVWLNNGTGFTNVTSTGSGNPLNGITILSTSNKAWMNIVADFDDDGDQDIYNSYTGQYYINSGSSYSLASGAADILSTVSSASYTGGNLVFTLTADLNADGRPDLVTLDNSAYTQRVWLNNGSGFTEVTGAGSSNPLNGITILSANNKASMDIVADFDYDGDLDIYDSYDGKYYINNGASYSLASGATDIFSTISSTAVVSGSSSYTFTLAADLNTDGLMDVVTISNSDNSQQVWLNNGSGFTDVTSAGAGNPLDGITILSVNNKASMDIVADFDGDGDQDIYNSYTGAYEIQQVAPPAIATTTPANGAAEVSVTPDIILDFNENISSEGAGTIGIYRASDNSLVESFAGTDSRVTVSGSQVTLQPSTTLSVNTDYYVLVAKRAFFDVDGMTFQGISGTSDLRFTTTSSLPLTLVNFTGTQEGNTVVLRWTTTNEVNTQEMQVQRSYTGNDFRQTGTVSANGSGNHHYSFTDVPDAGQPNLYYRLKLIDKDGASKYSWIVALHPQADQKLVLQLYPNPVSGSFNLVAPAGITSGEVSIYNNLGTKVVQQEWRAGQTINVSALVSGVYIVRLTSRHQLFHIGFTKE